MAELECSICFYSFNGVNNLPRILQCGHTICTQCLGSILQTSKSCPSCRKTTIYDSVDNYIVNYTVLELSETKELGQQHSKENCIRKRKEEHRELRTTLESLRDSIKSNEEQLASFSNSIASFDSRESRNKIQNVDERFDSIRHQLHQLSDSHVINEVSLMSKDFESAEEFIQEIHKLITVENKKVAAVLKIKGVKQFAKLSIRDDLLFIHSFERCMEKNHDVTTVCFQDMQYILLKSRKAKTILGFLDLHYRKDNFSRRRVLIEMEHSNSSLGSQFLKLCSGELGISYKGREYDQNYGEEVAVANNNNDKCRVDSIIEIRNMHWNMKEMYNFSAYFLKTSNEVACSANVFYATLEENGEFEIFRFYDHPDRLLFNSIIGTVKDTHKDFHSTFRDSSCRKVFDCGIAVKL